MIKLENVAKYYHNEGAVTLGLRKINLEFKLGEFVAVTGESGSGKSTLLNVISGIDSYEDGEMYIDGEETSYFDDADWEQYRRDAVGFIFQNYNLIDSYTVLKNVETALIIQGMPKKVRLQKAKAIIERVGLTNHLRHRASKLSGGEKQRLSIARALAKETKIIVADEPTGNLDSESSKQVLKLLKEVADGRLVVIVTHDFENVEPYVTRKIRLFDGEVVEDKKLRDYSLTSIPEKTIGKMSTIAKTFQIAIYNLLSQPKKTILLLLVAITTLFFVFINYGSKLVAQNMDHYGNGLYNSYPERLVVTRKNKAPLTTTDYDYFMSQSEITKVIIPDLVVDAQFHINFQIKDSYYYEDGFLNFNNDFAHQVVIGRLPQADNEIALAFNPYSIDENNLDKPLNAIYDISISTANGYFQMPYKLVGIYPTTDQSQFILSEGGITKLYDLMKISLKGYQFIVKDGGVEQNLPYGMISVNNSLSEHNIKISLYYKDILPGNLEQAEVSLNNVPVTITFDALTDHYNTIFVSPSFFQELKVDEDYQYTLNLKDKDQANKVINRLFDNGYYAFSPFLASKVIDFDAIFSVITNIFATLGVLFSVAVTFIISYLVVRSILLSKKKDYTILRIIGLKFQELKQVAVLEIITIFLGALLILSGIYITLIIGSYEIRNLVNKTFTFWNYFSLITLSLAVMILIAWRFTRMMTKKSLFMNLKVEGE